MFNSYNVTHKHQVAEVTRVVEKTVSPDKITEMYDRVKEEVLATLIKSVVIKNTLFDCAVQIYRNAQENTFQLQAKITLNGIDIFVEKTLPDRIHMLTNAEILDFAKNAFADVVASKVIGSKIIVLKSILHA